MTPITAAATIQRIADSGLDIDTGDYRALVEVAQWLAVMSKPTTDYDFRFITVKRAMTNGKPVESSIQSHVNTNGLAYHLSFGDNGKWTVAHTQSGYTLCDETTRFKNETQCRSFIDRIAALSDWLAERPQLSESTKTVIRRIATDCQAGNIYTEVL